MILTVKAVLYKLISSHLKNIAIADNEIKCLTKPSRSLQSLLLTASYRLQFSALTLGESITIQQQ